MSESSRRTERASLKGWAIVAWQSGIILGALLVWEAAVDLHFADKFFFGRPSEVISYLVTSTLNGYLIVNTWVTVYEVVLGFCVGTVLGTAAGLALWWSPYWSRVLEPFAVVLNATPKIVIAPLLIVWFGIGLTSKVMIAVSICAVVAWLGAFDGMRAADADQADMLRGLGGRRHDVFFKVIVPSTLPWIFNTMRINIGFALIGVITGEFLSSTQGLGYLVDSTAKLYQISHTFAALVMIAALAALQFYLVGLLEEKLLPWAKEAEVEFIT